ncbi:hypothetical protein ACFL2Q_19505, partial [Thermodesulfobacteriota bacterium]
PWPEPPLLFFSKFHIAKIAVQVISKSTGAGHTKRQFCKSMTQKRTPEERVRSMPLIFNYSLMNRTPVIRTRFSPRY